MKRTAVIAAALVLAGCGGDESTPAAAPESVKVHYFVEGTAPSVHITYETVDGSAQQSGLALPLETVDGEEGMMFMARPGAFIYIAAQNEGDDGLVTCRIEVDGEVVSENTSVGGHSIATCKGSA